MGKAVLCVSDRTHFLLVMSGGGWVTCPSVPASCPSRLQFRVHPHGSLLASHSDSLLTPQPVVHLGAKATLCDADPVFSLSASQPSRDFPLGTSPTSFRNLFREREKGGWVERNTNLLFHLFMHALVDSCMCPDRRLNP